MSFRVLDSPGSTSSAMPSSRPQSLYKAEELSGLYQDAMAGMETGSGPMAESIFASLLLEQRKALEVMLLVSSKKLEKITATGADKL